MFAILYPPPHIPSGSEQNRTESHQIPTIFLPRKKKSVPISFRVIPSSFRVIPTNLWFQKKNFFTKSKCQIPTKFRVNSGSIPSPFRPNSDQIPTKFWVYSESIPTKFRPNSDQILGLF